MQRKADVTDPRVIRALSHPIRVDILKALEDGEASPSDVARTIEKPTPVVSYHFNLLSELGLITLVRTAPRRGVLEHYYAMVTGIEFELGAWEDIPRLARQGAASSSLAEISVAIVEAASAHDFDPQEARAALQRLALDERGRREAADAIDALRAKLREIGDESRARADGDGVDGLQDWVTATIHLHAR